MPRRPTPPLRAPARDRPRDVAQVALLMDHTSMVTVQTEKYGLIDCKPLGVLWGSTFAEHEWRHAQGPVQLGAYCLRAAPPALKPCRPTRAKLSDA